MPRMAVIVVVFAVSACAQTQAQNTTVESFQRAKKLMVQVFKGNQVTLYCGCQYQGKSVDHASCGYKPIRPGGRAERLEWEHVVPAQAFGQSFKEWRDGHPDCVDSQGKPYKGRRCARKVSRQYRLMEADLYNLQPAIGEVNGLRGHFAMGMIPGEERRFGACDVEIEDRKIEPRPAVRGDIARTYRYMHRAYPGRGIISKKNKRLFEAWDRADPVDSAEQARVAIIQELLQNGEIIVSLSNED